MKHHPATQSSAQQTRKNTVKRLERWARQIHVWGGIVLVVALAMLALTGWWLLHPEALADLGRVRVAVDWLPGHYARTAPVLFEAVVPSGPNGELAAVGKAGLWTRGAGALPWRQRLGPETVGHLRAVAADGDQLWMVGKNGAFVGGPPKSLQRLPLPDEVAKQARGLQVVRPDRVAILLADGQAWTCSTAQCRLEPGTPGPGTGQITGVELKKLVVDLHTGKFFDGWLSAVYDAAALGLAALALSGAYVFAAPRLRRRARTAARSPQGKKAAQVCSEGEAA